MGNIIRIKNGSTVPSNGTLSKGELGYKWPSNEAPGALYIGSEDGIINVTGSNAIFSTVGTGNTVQLANGESGSNIYPVIRGEDLIEEVPIEQGGTSATNVLDARENLSLNTPSFNGEIRLNNTITTSATSGLKIEYYTVSSQKRVRFMEI